MSGGVARSESEDQQPIIYEYIPCGAILRRVVSECVRVCVVHSALRAVRDCVAVSRLLEQHFDLRRGVQEDGIRIVVPRPATIRHCIENDTVRVHQ